MRNSGNNAKRFEISLKPFEKNKGGKIDKRIENAIDDDSHHPQQHPQQRIMPNNQTQKEQIWVGNSL